MYPPGNTSCRQNSGLFLVLYYSILDIPLYNMSRKRKTTNSPNSPLFLNRFPNFFTFRFCRKFAAKIPLHLVRVATLPCETLLSENERQAQTNAVINDNLQGTGVTCLRCFGISMTKLRQVYCWVCQCIFLNRWLFSIVTGKRWIVTCTFFDLAVWWPGSLSAWDDRHNG